MVHGVVRNLLGRLNARSPSDIDRIAEHWQVPLSGNDVRRHVGALYRTMTDARAARTFYADLEDDRAAILRSLALADAELRTLSEIAELAGRPEDVTRDAAVWLFQAGVLAREGDHQELPIDAIPRLFLPRELDQVFTRVLEQIDLGDMRRESLRALFPILDEGDIEDAARSWGMQVIPGLRNRNELTEELLRLIDDPDRVRRISGTLSLDGKALWDAVRDASEHDDGLPYQDALVTAGLLPNLDAAPRHARDASRILQAVQELERRLLVWHSYDDAGNRWLFVPDEILNPGSQPRNLTLETLTPVDSDDVTADPPRHPHAVAWDVLTVMRELAAHRSPVWNPGEPLSRGWQRQVNGRLWFAGDQTPPDGYAGFLLSLALLVELVEPSETPSRSGVDRGAFRPQLTDRIRTWRSQQFSQQTAELRAAWLSSEAWIEGRERDELEVWGAYWPDVRKRLLETLGTFESGVWFRQREFAQRLAEQYPGLLGTTFTVASSRGSDSTEGEEGRVAKIAHVIATEVEAAFLWFGLVESGSIGNGTRRIRTVRVTEAGKLAANRPDIVPGDDAVLSGSEPLPADSSVLAVSAASEIELLRPAPLHVWSLSAFSEQLRLEPTARYELSKPSLGRALGAGFDLDQVVRYLERQSGEAVPETVLTNLREWTAGYRRVRLRRMLVVQPDDTTLLKNLERVLQEEGFALAERSEDGTALRVFLPETGDDAAGAEEALQRALRSNGFVGQWPRSTGTPESKRDKP